MTVNPPLEGLEVIAAGENSSWQGVPPHGCPVEEGGLVERSSGSIQLHHVWVRFIRLSCVATKNSPGRNNSCKLGGASTMIISVEKRQIRNGPSVLQRLQRTRQGMIANEANSVNT